MFTGKAAEGTLDDLPAAFDQPAQSQRSQVLDVNGDVLAYFYDENRVYVPLADIAPVMQQAIISIEDHRFYEHGPLDAVGTLRALLTNVVAGGVTQGGSTLTQQYVKMVQIEEAKKAGDEAGVAAAQDDSYGRKIRELRYAISVEKTLSKDQILERYLNIAYYGDGAYGVEVAAQHYFGTTAAKLTLPQAALLAGLVQNPTANNPVQNPTAGLQRRNVVINRMAALDVITDAEAAKAIKTKFNKKKVTSTINGCQGTDYPFLCDYVYRSLEQTPSLGDTVETRQQTIKRGGLVIKTKIDPDTQDQTQKAVSKVVGPTDPVISAMDMIEPGTGLIVAMAQSRPVMGDNTKKGRDLLELLRHPGDGRRAGVPGRFDVQGLHRGGRAGAGHPAVQALQRRADDGLLRTHLRDLRRSQPGRRQLAGQQLHRCQRDDGHVPGGGVLGEHLLRPARPRRRHVQRGADGREAGHRVQHQGRAGQLLRRQAVVHPGHPRGEPAVGGRGVRDLRLRWHPLRPDHPRVDHRQHRRGPRGAERELRAGDQRGRRQRDELAARLGDDRRHRPTGADRRRSPAGRQDGHHRQQRGGLVRRLHPAGRGRRDDQHRQHPRAVPEGQGELPLDRPQGLHHPVHRPGPRGLGQRRRRSGDLEAGDGGVPAGQGDAELQRSAARPRQQSRLLRLPQRSAG